MYRGSQNGKAQAWWRARSKAWRNKQRQRLKEAMAHESEKHVQEAVRKRLEEMRQKQKEDFNDMTRGSNEGNNFE